MSRLQEIIPNTLSLGEPIKARGLCVIPILTEEIPNIPAVDTLDAALGKETVRITETSEAGEVPFVHIENMGDQPLMILDGEEILGGKQNRIVNSTLLILAHSTVKTPVSCIQSGRWQPDRADFQSANACFPAKSRAVHKWGVTANVRQSGTHLSRQGEVWDCVASRLHELAVNSPTANFEEGRQRVTHRIDEFINAIQPIENMVGALFMGQTVTGQAEILGGEILATPTLLGANWSKMIRSYSFEVINAPNFNGTGIDGAKTWWAGVKETNFTEHPSPAAGIDVRLDTSHLIGSGLLWHDALVHLSCFPNVRMKNDQPNSRRASVRDRRRNLRSNIE